MKTILSFALVASLLSCNKYEHPDDYFPNCDLCAFAESIEGTYRGEVQGLQLSTNTNYTDSVTMTVEHIFLSNNLIDDSTNMYFAITHERDSIDPGIFYDTIQIRSLSGRVKKSEHLDSWIRNDTIYRKTMMTSFNLTTFTTSEAYLYKQ